MVFYYYIVMALFKNVSLKIKPKRIIEHDLSPDDTEPQPINFETYYDVYKKCPELVGVINTLVTDIIGSGWTLTGDDKKIKAMNKLLIDINFRAKLKNFLIHAFLTGEGYLEYQKVNREKAYELVKRTYKDFVSKVRVEKSYRNKINFNKKFIDKEAKRILKFIEDNYVLPFNLNNIKSSTIEIKVNDKGDVIGYIQKVNNEEIKFSPEEIIRWGPFNLGEVYNFTPTKSVLSDIATLIFAKEYAGKFFENGGEPNAIYILPKARGLDDRNYQVLKKELQEARKKKNWHKVMVFTGEVQREKLNDFNKDLEFPQLIKEMTMRILMAFGVPPTQTPFGSTLKGSARELNENYWKNIDFWQRELEDLFNKYIFNDYGITFRLSKPYKIDELREAQILGILVDRGLISLKEARERIGYYGEIPNDLLPKQPRRDLPQRDLGDRQDARGLGMDVGRRLANLVPSISKSQLVIDFDDPNVKKVNVDDFIKIVEARGTFQTQKVFYKDNGDTYILYYSDGLFIYYTEVNKEDFNDELLMGAIKVV